MTEDVPILFFIFLVVWEIGRLGVWSFGKLVVWSFGTFLIDL
jgi:hypothetical protein